jgi:hypothetical protein
LALLPRDRQATWEALITRAEVGSPEDFALHNGWVNQLLQTAWSAIATCGTEGPGHFEDALRIAVAAGGDTPTVAAVTGGLLGARWGVSAIPLEWRRRIFGWPGYRDRDLVRAVVETVGRGTPRHQPDVPPTGVPRHPFDAGLMLGSVADLAAVPGEVDAVVALCPLGSVTRPDGVPAPNQVDVWLVDSEESEDNPHLEHVVDQAVELVMRLRGEGHRVLLHSTAARSRLPMVAAVYGARLAALPALEVLGQIEPLLPARRSNARFDEILRAWD